MVAYLPRTRACPTVPLVLREMEVRGMLDIYWVYVCFNPCSKTRLVRYVIRR